MLKIVVDTREQTPWLFQGPRFAEVEVERAALATGDYSLAGLEDMVAIERKSLADLLGCLTHERERFERELERGRCLDFFAVLVEGSFADLASGEYRSAMQPHAACQSVLAMMTRGTPFLFAGSHSGGQYACWSLLRHYQRRMLKRKDELMTQKKRLDRMINALKESEAG